MAFKGITVNTAPEESAHIYAQDDAAIYQSIFGGDGVLNTGNKFKATVLSNNSIRVSDGLMCIGGHIGRTEYGSYNDLTIQNGAAGYNRNDIIYARFITNGNIDTYALAVKKGTAAAGVAVDPVMIQGNLYEGEASREYPLWRVRLEGLSITKVEQMFRIIPTIPDLEAQYDALNEGLGGKTIAEAIRDLNTDLSGKISKTDIKNNLTSMDTDKPLSAAQGRALANGNANDSTARLALTKNVASINFSSSTIFTTFGVQYIVKVGKMAFVHLYFSINTTLEGGNIFAVIPSGFFPDRDMPQIPLINVLNGSRGTVTLNTNGIITGDTGFSPGNYGLDFLYPIA